MTHQPINNMCFGGPLVIPPLFIGNNRGRGGAGSQPPVALNSLPLNQTISEEGKRLAVTEKSPLLRNRTSPFMLRHLPANHTDTFLPVSLCSSEDDRQPDFTRPPQTGSITGKRQRVYEENELYAFFFFF